MISTTYNEEALFLFWYPANRHGGGASVVMDFALPGKVATGKSGRQERSAFGESLRIPRFAFETRLFKEELPEFNRALRFGHTTERILVPVWSLDRPTAEFAALPIKGAVNVSYPTDSMGYPLFGAGFEIHAGDAPATSFAGSHTAPLIFARFETRPDNLPLETDEDAYLAVEFFEDSAISEQLQFSGSAFASGPALGDATTPKVFPFLHDFSRPAQTGSRLQVAYETKGYGRRSKVEYHGAYAETPLSINCFFESVQEACDIVEFFRQMGGMSRAWWVPQYLADARLSADADAADTQIEVEDATGIALHQWIALFGPNGEAYRRVESIAGTTLQLDAAVGMDLPYQDSSLSALLLARFEKGVIRLSWDTDINGYAQIEAIEATAEYAPSADEERGVTLGALPTRSSIIVFSGDGHTWSYAPYERDVTYSGGVATAIPIDHSDIALGLKLKDSVTVTSYLSACEPLRRLAALELDELDVRIIRADISDGVASNETQIFSGRGDGADETGDDVSCAFRWLGNVFAAQVPRRYLQRTCQKKFGSAACGVDLADWTFTAEIVDAGAEGWPFTMTIGNITRDNGAAVPAFFLDWFAWGAAWVGDGSFLQTQFIAASSAISGGEIILTLEGDLAPYPINGDTIKLQPECNKLAVTCKAYNATTNPLGKFDNYDEFSGVIVAKGNLSLIKVSENVGGGKK